MTRDDSAVADPRFSSEPAPHACPATARPRSHTSRPDRMTPEAYEHHVAAVLRSEGWVARVTPGTHDFGLDVIADRGATRLGVQVKMYGDSSRRVGTEAALHLFGAAAFADCQERLIATNG